MLPASVLKDAGDSGDGVSVPQGPTYRGVVVRLGQTPEGTVFCFLRCTETFILHNHDIYLQQGYCGTPLEVGAVIQFQLHEAEGRWPTATKATAVTDIEEYLAIKQAENCEVLDGVARIGWVLTSDPVRGHAVIDCEDLQGYSNYNRGIYVPKQRAVGLTPGSKVAFNLEITEKGRLQALNICVYPDERLGKSELHEKVSNMGKNPNRKSSENSREKSKPADNSNKAADNSKGKGKSIAHPTPRVITPEEFKARYGLVDKKVSAAESSIQLTRNSGGGSRYWPY